MPAPGQPGLTRFHLRRSIVIGLGGTGRHVCTQLKKLLRESFGENGFPHLRVLSIDTAAKAKTIGEEDGSLLQLAPEERLGLRIPPHLNRDRFNEFMGDREKSLLPFANDQGAKRCRPIGHAFLVTNWAEVRRQIRDLAIGLMSADLRDLVRRSPEFSGLELDSSRIDFYVVANLVSGTGSGMSLGMGYLLRDLVRDLSQQGATEFMVEGIFTTCGLFALQDMVDRPSDYAVNCYAAVLELSHFSKRETFTNRRARYRTGFDAAPVYEEALGQAPYDKVQLLNPSHSRAGNMSVEQFEPYIAKVLALRTGSSVGMTANEKIIDEEALRPPVDAYGNERFCWAWGAESFRSSGRELLDLAAGLACRQVLALLAGEGGDAGGRAQQAAAQLAQALGVGEGERGPTLTAVLTPKEPLEGGAPGAGLRESIPLLVRRDLPEPPDDPDFVRTLRLQVESRQQALVARLRGQIAAIAAENRRRLAEEKRSLVFEELARLADASLLPAGSLRLSLRTLDLLLGVPGGEAGLLVQASETCQREGQAAARAAEAGAAAAKQGEHAVKAIAKMGRGFTIEALQGAWRQMTDGLKAQLEAEAVQKALEEVRLVLDGDGKDRHETLRLGLLKTLEQRRQELESAIAQMEKLGEGLDERLRQVRARLEEAGGQTDVASLEAEARELCEQALAADGRRQVAAELVAHLGSLGRLPERYRRSDQRGEDLRFLERLVRKRVEQEGKGRLLRSLEEDPTFGGRLGSYLERAEPAIHLNPDIERPGGIAFLAVPQGAAGFKEFLVQQTWLRERSGLRTPQELVEERQDQDPRVEVLTATLTFSPAAILGMDDWAARYQRATRTLTALRSFHTVAERSGGKQLIFEPLGTTRPRIELAYLIGRACGWLEARGNETVYRWPGGDDGLVTVDRTFEFAVPLEHPDVLTGMTRPLQDDSHGASLGLPVFLHILRRFLSSLDPVGDPFAGPGGEMSCLAEALRDMIERRGPLGTGAVLPNPNDGAAFRSLDYSLRCLLGAGDLYERLQTDVRRPRAQAVPAPGAGAGRSLREPPPKASPAVCPSGHPVVAGQSFCGQCGARVAPPTCSSCQSEIPAESLFCGRCGANVSAAPRLEPAGP